MNLRFYENLCEANEMVVRSCRKLKQSGRIHEYYIRNGFVKIKIEEGNRSEKIHHPDNLFQQFDVI